LVFGILSGLAMALGFNGLIDVNPHSLLNVHTYALVVGFVVLLIMAVSIILVPMFGYSKRISDNDFSTSFLTLSFGVAVMSLSPLFFTSIMQDIAYVISMVAVLLYFYQLFHMFKSRKKIIHDDWAKSTYVGFLSFIVAFTLFCFYLFNENETVLRLGMWIMLVGFFGFLIIGNFYKIIPFLIWFQVYSPLIEERAVPMLHELTPNKLTNLQWFYSTSGLIITSIGVFLQDDGVFFGGALLLSVGGALFFFVINKILKANL